MTPWSLKQVLQISKIKKSDNYVQLGLLEISNVRCITTHNWSLILIIEGIQIFCGLFEMLTVFRGLPKWYSGQESTCQSKRHRFYPWIRKIPWSRKWKPTSVSLPGESYGQRSLVSYSPWGCKGVGHDWARARETVFRKNTQRWMLWNLNLRY